MSKKIFKIWVVLLLMFSGATLVGCETFDLKEYKVEAKRELDIYVKNKNNEYLGNREIILEIVANSKQAVDEATNKPGVDEAVAKAKETIDKMAEDDIILQVKQTYVDRFLKEEYPEATVADVVVTRYLGTYDGSFVAVLNDNFHKYFTEPLITYKYEGFDFSYSNGYPIRVWNSGKFYDIAGAFKQELLTKHDLQTIATLYNGKEKVDMVTQVKQSYLDCFIKRNRPDATIDDVVIMDYLGTYNGNFVAVFYDKQNCTFIDRLNPQEIAGMNFSFSEGYPIFVWKKGVFSLLHEVYEQGEITKSDLATIHFLYSNKAEQQIIK